MPRAKRGRYSIYFGDLHTHNEVGYGMGSLARTYDIARRYLDFLCFTPHAYQDVLVGENMEKDIAGKKFKRKYIKIAHDRWPDVVKSARRYNRPGKFVTFLGYERHSKAVGDYCIIFPSDGRPLNYYRKLEDFKRHARESGAIIVPHSPAYPPGSTGSISRLWDGRLSPIVEIYSTHGCAESDTAPQDYTRHPGAGRVSSQTMQAHLAEGHRFGVVGSTDNHIGFPGGNWEGKAAIIAPELTREALLAALKARRTYAVSGDRIELDFRLNGHLMGEEMPYNRKRKISAEVSGRHWLERVEVLKNNRVIYRDFPIDRVPPRGLWKGPVLLRIEYGWGPMLMHRMPLDYVPPVCDWDMRVSLKKSKILDIQPAFQSIPFDERRRHIIRDKTKRGFNLISYTARRRSYEHCDTNGISLKVLASPGDELKIEIKKPRKVTGRIKLSELLKNDHNIALRRPETETISWSQSVRISRIVPEVNFKTAFTIEDIDEGRRTDWYYLRAFQTNRQFAWSSPIWVEKK